MRLFNLLDNKSFYYVTLFGAFFLGLSFFPVPAPAAERLLSLQIGPSWPEDASPAWDAEAMYGLLVDKKVGFGIAVDFLWNTSTQERPVSGSASGQMETVKDVSNYMFPVMGFIVFDPIPYQVIHPLLNFKIGYNSLSYTLTMPVPDPKLPPSGYYYGLIIKAGADGLYNLGEQAAVFLGLEYQWADTKSTKDSEGHFRHMNMSGAGLHLGFRFLL
jgi:hypothetical protein